MPLYDQPLPDDDEMEDCPDCRGRGKRKFYGRDEQFNHFRVIRCPRCRGEGDIPARSRAEWARENYRD